MRFKGLYLLVLVLLFSCKQNEKKEIREAISEKIEGIKVYNYSQLEPLLNKKDDKTYVVNFWATWCKPCVDELPVFEKINTEFKDKNVEVLLVSLDFSNQIEDQLIPFIKDNKLQSKVVLLDDPDQNKWINKINEKWSGAIPATLIYNKNKRAFYEQSFEYESLLKELNKLIN
ncbi:thiol-disulfide isomerase/thioredoxin [Tenacibaculum adriaticum]|uniref:Thiol-disulfide isomerase/thioredoxin n=1 Tax=Tenacibaculum adriaticum TaxID=413713 RepID=A0A5S5DNQ7_9FLAO|nr:TlpA disulfide reductase family protein [Tenacibaculum adriaticum]TYP97547.1 thiol-disulfide isomerase/thioredoxin [Tenacibaculum adriaticum]